MHNSIEPTNCIQRVRTLPTEVPPPYNWQEFRRRAQRRSPATRVATDWRPLAAAAALLLFVCAIAVWGRFGGGGRRVLADSGAADGGVKSWNRGVGSATDADRWQRAQARALDDAQGALGEIGSDDVVAAPDGVSAQKASGTIESSIVANRSRAIESWLASLPQERAVVHVGTRAPVASLEDRIAQVDDLMTSLRVNGTPSDRVAALQRERLRLVGSLAQVRYADVVASQSP